MSFYASFKQDHLNTCENEPIQKCSSFNLVRHFIRHPSNLSKLNLNVKISRFNSKLNNINIQTIYMERRSLKMIIKVLQYTYFFVENAKKFRENLLNGELAQDWRIVQGIQYLGSVSWLCPNLAFRILFHIPVYRPKCSWARKYQSYGHCAPNFTI